VLQLRRQKLTLPQKRPRPVSLRLLRARKVAQGQRSLRRLERSRRLRPASKLSWTALRRRKMSGKRPRKQPDSLRFNALKTKRKLRRN